MDIKKIQKEYSELLNQLSDPELISDWEKFEELSKKKKELEKIIEKDKEIKEIQKKIQESKNMLKSEQDADMIALAETEVQDLEKQEEKLTKELEDEINPQKQALKHGSIIEIRAGTGGDEAALFANDLFNMYSRYADIKKWKTKVLDSKPTELGGTKEIVFEIKDNKSFIEMRNEGGVHRVQRIPETEKSGRVHTSTATVAVLPKPKSTDIKIKTDDIKVDLFRSSGPGGQNVNKRETAVRITHIPTGIIVSSQRERNQLQNKENALSILSAKLLEKQQEEAENAIGGKRNEQIGKAKRSEKIRTYNFPQNRVTDHRIKKSWHNIEDMMQGKLDKMIQDIQNELE